MQNIIISKTAYKEVLMKKECVMIVVLLIIIIILLIVIIRQNMELRSQLINIGNYLSEKLDNLSSAVKMLNE